MAPSMAWICAGAGGPREPVRFEHGVLDDAAALAIDEALRRREAPEQRVVGDADVAAHAPRVERMPRRDGVQVVARGKRRVCPVALVEIDPDDRAIPGLRRARTSRRATTSTAPARSREVAAQ